MDEAPDFSRARQRRRNLAQLITRMKGMGFPLDMLPLVLETDEEEKRRNMLANLLLMTAGQAAASHVGGAIGLAKELMDLIDAA